MTLNTYEEFLEEELIELEEEMPTCEELDQLAINSAQTSGRKRFRSDSDRLARPEYDVKLLFSYICNYLKGSTHHEREY